MELIPAIDLIEGRCVRLTQGDYAQRKVYDEHPLEVAKAFEQHGVKRLHVVDLDGAKAQHIVNWKVLETLTAQTGLTVDFGGGLKSDDDLRIAFECGASMVTGGSIAVRRPDIFRSWLLQYGNERIILGADVRDEKISVSGWTETTECSIEDFLTAYITEGRSVKVRKVICTDISRDGMLQGPSVALYRRLQAQFPDMYLIASGGVSSMADILELEQAGLPAVIFGKAIYEGRISLKDIERFIVGTE